MVVLCISDFRRLHRFSIEFIFVLLPGHGRVSMPCASRNSVTEPHSWQELQSCMKMRSAVPYKPRWGIRRFFNIVLHFTVALNEVQTAMQYQTLLRHTTPWSACYLHVLDDTVLSKTFNRHATDVLHLLVLALDDALVAKHHLRRLTVHVHLAGNPT